MSNPELQQKIEEMTWGRETDNVYERWFKETQTTTKSYYIAWPKIF